MSAPPIMLFSLWPAMTSARIAGSVASTSRPARTPLMAAAPRILSEPALQMVRRTTPRGSRSTPQWGLSMCMADLTVAQSSLAEVPQIDAAFIPVIGYYMTANIQWDAHALFEGTQAGNPRQDREEGLGTASREGRARHRRRRPDEGRRPHPWRLLRAFRFAG